MSSVEFKRETRRRALLAGTSGRGETGSTGDREADGRPTCTCPMGHGGMPTMGMMGLGREPGWTP